MAGYMEGPQQALGVGSRMNLGSWKNRIEGGVLGNCVRARSARSALASDATPVEQIAERRRQR